MSAPPPRQSGFNWWLALFPIVLLTLFVWWRMRRGEAQPEPVSAEEQAFNMQEVPKTPSPEAAAATGYVSSLERQERQREASGPGLAGFVQENDSMFYKDPQQKTDEEREREQEMIRKYDPAVQQELGKLKNITDRYYKKEPVVREVDRAFGALPRYMALRAQYQRDHNPYDFIRGAVALPEVRKTVYKFSLNADVWRVTLGMVTEGLREKPPPPVYDECKRFMTDDKNVAKFVTDLTGYLTPRVGTLLPQALRPGQDLKPLQQLAGDIGVPGTRADLSQARAAVGQEQQNAGQ